MTGELIKARELLLSGGYTCVLMKGDILHISHERGVKPLVTLLQSDADVRGFCAADKVVGKATAFLYCLLGVEAVYAPVISFAAAEVLRRHGVHAEYEEQVDFIWNRRRTAPCPMETAVKDLDDAQEALTAITATLAAMK